MTADQVANLPAGDSPKASSPCETGGEALENKSQQNGGATVTSNATVAAPSQTAESNRTIAHETTSQPMTSNTISSNPLPKEVTNGAAPYGTRSRNRSGNSRPNYAEDKDLDADLELAAIVKETNGRKTTRATTEPDPPSNTDTVRSTNTSRRAAIPETENVQIQNQQKDQIPGTSSFAANPTGVAPTSKKRKAAGPPATTTHQSHPQSTHTSHLTRRASMAAHSVGGTRESNMLSFDNYKGQLKGQKLIADDGTMLELNDHVYLVCEPPGEPYYLGRIMEFLHLNNDSEQPIDALRLNWYYRPKDIGRRVNDTRQVFASMHSDISPLTALRGKCQIKHKSELEKLEEYRKNKDCFWYEKLYDRYIHRFYDVIPTSQVINVPVEVKKVLDERWNYILVEPGRGKELTSAVKSCKRCSKYCASNDSVDCAVCQNTYHMSCVNPPLLKKPSRGFAWACGPCSKAQERKLEARNTPNILETTADVEEDEVNDEEDESPGQGANLLDTGRNSPDGPSEAESSVYPGTVEQIHQASLWLFRYLGIHCKVEDALDYDDRIYPRASSRLGPRHQANVPAWPGQPIEYVKPTEIKKKYVKGGNKKDAKLSKESIAAIEAEKIALEKRPKWVMDEPPGYIRRGEDIDNDDPENTARLLYKPPEAGAIPIYHTPGKETNVSVYLDVSAREQYVDDYLRRAKGMAKALDLPENSTNLQDVALEILCFNCYDAEAALSVLPMISEKIFKEPKLSPAELKKFEDGVTKFGSEWHSIKKHVKTVSPADIVRFYYTWKKTNRGKQVWGNYSGRKGKKEAKKAEATAGKLQDDVADEYDDSAFDNDKALEKKRGFQCKFCGIRSSRQWRRAPNTPAGTTVPENPNGKSSGKDRGNQLMVALCLRCAELWRRYAIQWEDIDEVAKKVAQTGGRAWKRKIDDELLKELTAANEVVNQPVNVPTAGPGSTGGTPAPSSGQVTGHETPRKKLKGAAAEKDASVPALDPEAATTTVQPKKKAIVEAAPPPPPEPPKPKILPCAVCDQMEPMGDQHISCKECRMAVHRNCYGAVGDDRIPGKWTCDMCLNDKNPQVSIQYKCMLCPVELTKQDFLEAPKSTHKKKSDKERERDRIERENAEKVAEFFRKKQEDMNKPDNPREPLKRTANNNWVHVTCAVFTPEVKFGNAKALMPSEGIPLIPSARYAEVCKVCKEKGGACVTCHSCRVPVHVECAHHDGYLLGFDITPVKGSRRDHVNIVNVKGEVGVMSAGVWCKEHIPTKTVVHRLHDPIDDTGLTALQFYAQKYKQADLMLTGTVRKANLVKQSTKAVHSQATSAPVNRRTSTATTSGQTGVRASTSLPKHEEGSREATLNGNGYTEKICITCDIDISPKWWPLYPKSHGVDVPVMSLSNSINGVDPEQPTTNSHLEVGGGGPVAMAAAALHRNTQSPLPESTEVQCHKCHCKQVRKEPSPMAVDTESPRVPFAPNSTTAIDSVDSGAVQMIAPQYSQPPPPHPRSSLGPLFLERTRAAIRLAPPDPPGQDPYYHRVDPWYLIRDITHLPESGYGRLIETPNGGQSPNHTATAPLDLANGSNHSYTPTQQPPQHLMNGGPPPRASETPVSQNGGPMHSHPSSTPHGSPPMSREGRIQGRNIDNHQNASRSNEGRVNGGASESPNLRYLLS